MSHLNCNCKGGCSCSWIAKILLVVGGINWGLIGVGIFMDRDLNVVYMLLGSWPTVEAIVYILVGASALYTLFGCKCGKCKAACSTCVSEDMPKNPAGNM